MADKRRRSREKKINPTYFIFCEGETEEAYINYLKSYYRIPSIQIHAKIGGLKIDTRFIEKYKTGKVTHEKDLDFLLYDLDTPGILKRLQSIGGATLLVSNPCIELWFLLHYKNQTALQNCEYCCKELKNRNKGYKKGDISRKLIEKLEGRAPEAKKRAKALTPHNNPSTTVYKLIEMLEDLKK